jgi:hypothetical protein
VFKTKSREIFGEIHNRQSILSELGATVVATVELGATSEEPSVLAKVMLDSPVGLGDSSEDA